MTDREMKKLSRSQLLEMLLTQAQEVKRLRGELEAAQTELENRSIRMTEVGNIAEAALKMNGVFEAAQSAADQYLQNVSAVSARTLEKCRKLEEETRLKCEAMVRGAEQEAAAFWESIRERVQGAYLSEKDQAEILQILTAKSASRYKEKR